jgi:hypothetical protein
MGVCRSAEMTVVARAKMHSAGERRGERNWRMRPGEVGALDAGSDMIVGERVAAGAAEGTEPGDFERERGAAAAQQRPAGACQIAFCDHVLWMR